MIPKTLHQIWIGDENPCPWAWIESWRTFNPSWRHVLWTEIEIEQFRLVNKKQYDAVSRLDGKADIARYEILLRHGGLFVDADAECLMPLDEDFVRNDSFACYENEVNMPGVISNGYLACTVGNRLMEELVRGISARSVADCARWAWDSEAQRDLLWEGCGPGYLTETVRALAYDKLTVYPSHYFIPIHNTGLKYNGNGPVFARQWWGSSLGGYLQCPPPSSRVDSNEPHFSEHGARDRRGQCINAKYESDNNDVTADDER